MNLIYSFVKGVKESVGVVLAQLVSGVLIQAVRIRRLRRDESSS